MLLQLPVDLSGSALSSEESLLIESPTRRRHALKGLVRQEVLPRAAAKSALERKREARAGQWTKLRWDTRNALAPQPLVMSFLVGP